MEWAAGGWQQKRDASAAPITVALDDLASRVGFVCVTPYIDPVAMGTSNSPHYMAFFK